MDVPGVICFSLLGLLKTKHLEDPEPPLGNKCRANF